MKAKKFDPGFLFDDAAFMLEYEKWEGLLAAALEAAVQANSRLYQMNHTFNPQTEKETDSPDPKAVRATMVIFINGCRSAEAAMRQMARMDKIGLGAVK